MSAAIHTNIAQACELLKAGKLVAIPTETVYGLAANALDADAVIRIFETKNRPSFDPLIVHVYSKNEVEKYVQEISPSARLLMDAFWPGPLTILLQRNDLIPDVVTSGLPTVGVRMPDHRLTLELLEQLKLPLAAPSANPFGYISPTRASHVADQLGEKIELIIDGGECRVGVESTIIDCTVTPPKILRLGGVSVESITSVIGEVEVQTNSSSSPQAPGMMLSHYAPRKKLILGNIQELLEQYTQNISILSFQEQYFGYRNYRLSEKGDLHEAARNLFTAMRILDSQPGDFILAETVPDTGIGLAINDRLRRASHP
ncbi:MAG: threonylcarbamoyl-AMP synthase [Flavobacteriales bacterium]|nr:threonylcarbamoyl-AMP synthase [Flavobacteriales bacterium]